MQRQIASWLTAVFALGCGPVLPRVEIDPGQVHQRIEGFGAATGSFTWEVYPEYTDPAFFDAAVSDLGVSIVRTPLPTTFELVNDDDDPDHIAEEGFDLYELDSRMRFLQEFAKRGVRRFFASPWSPPAFLKTNRTTVRGGSLRADARREYAEHLAAYVLAARKHWGIEITDLSLQNEPRFAQPYNSSLLHPAGLRELLRAVMERFESEGLDTRLWLPEDMQRPELVAQYLDPVFADPVTARFRGGIATHRYARGEALARAARYAAQHGRQSFMTETSGHPHGWEGALRLASDMHEYLTTGSYSAWLYWQLSKPRASEETLLDAGRPTHKSVVFAHYARFLGPGSERIGASSSHAEILVSAFRRAGDGARIVVVQNHTAEHQLVEIEVKERAAAERSWDGLLSTEDKLALPFTLPPGQVLSLPRRSVVTLRSAGAPIQPVRHASFETPPRVGRLAEPMSLPPSVPDWGITRWKLAPADPDAPPRPVHAADAFGWTDLHRAVLAGDESAAERLLARGADPLQGAADGWTPLHVAAASSLQNRAALLDLLIASGEDVDVPAADGWTPLIAAVANARGRGDAEDPADAPALSLVARLLDAGADLSLGDAHGRTALHWAAWQGQTDRLDIRADVVRLLMARGAAVDVVDDAGRTPRDYAEAEGHAEIASALAGESPGEVEAGSARSAAAPTTDPALDAALRDAAARGDLARVDDLLGRGASREARDADGMRAVDRARDHGHDVVVERLEAR